MKHKHQGENYLERLNNLSFQRPFLVFMRRRETTWQLTAFDSCFVLRVNPGYPIDEIDNRWQSISISTNRYQLID